MGSDIDLDKCYMIVMQLVDEGGKVRLNIGMQFSMLRKLIKENGI